MPSIVAYALIENPSRDSVLLGKPRILQEQLEKMLRKPESNKQVTNRRLHIPRTVFTGNDWTKGKFVAGILQETGQVVDIVDVLDQITRSDSGALWVVCRSVMTQPETHPRLTELDFYRQDKVFAEYLPGKTQRYFLTPKVAEYMRKQGLQQS